MKTLLLLLSLSAHAATLKSETAAIEKMAGCYLVDYNYAETDSLKPGYALDRRLYDVSKDKTVKEWIYVDKISPTRLRLQHVLFSTSLEGEVSRRSLLKHQAEDWELGAPALYDFVKPGHWDVKPLAEKKFWTRKVTNLDDGLRYQCAGAWDLKGEYPEWKCDNYAPIPGREYRDMGRKDYQGMERSTRIIVYPHAWLERQENTKVEQPSDAKTSLAKEAGKNWYVKLPDSECAPARQFAQKRKEFWKVLRETWDEVLTAKESFQEKNPEGAPPRYAKMIEIEDEFLKKGKFTAADKKAAKEKILATIGEYRVQPAK
jgi:hypothetical protein